MMFYSTQKEVKSYNIGRTFLPLFPRFYKGSIKTGRQSGYHTYLRTVFKIKENDITHQLYQILLKLFKNGNSNVKIIINKIKIKRSCHE